MGHACYLDEVIDVGHMQILKLVMLNLPQYLESVCSNNFPKRWKYILDSQLSL